MNKKEVVVAVLFMGFVVYLVGLVYARTTEAMEELHQQAVAQAQARKEFCGKQPKVCYRQEMEARRQAEQRQQTQSNGFVPGFLFGYTINEMMR